MSSMPASDVAQLHKPGRGSGSKPLAGQLDPFLSSIFLSAAALILAVENPINVEFVPRMPETLALCAVGIALLVWANIRRSLGLLLAGASVLILSVTLGVASQPSQVNLPVVQVWPLRIGLVLLVACAWAFLLQPPFWLRRALIAFALPSAAILALWIVPATTAQVFGWGTYHPFNNRFGPYWLAPDRQGGLYAADLDGVYVFAFDATGSPRGTLNPGKAQAVGTPGPGIVPIGLEAEVAAGSANPFVDTPTPSAYLPPGTVPRSSIPHFDFCGMTTDPNGNLYLIDLYEATGYKILRFDHDGNITARWPAPQKLQPTNACLAADSNYLYFSSIQGSKDGRLYVCDHNGGQVRQVDLPFLPLAIAANDQTPPGGKPGSKTVVAFGPGVIQRIEVNADSASINSLPTAPLEYQIPMILLRNGDLLLADHQGLKVGRFRPSTGQIVATIGKAGTLPGTFGDIGGMAEDDSGRIYISDQIHRVIQRFSPDGAINAVWWAQGLNNEAEFESEGR